MVGSGRICARFELIAYRPPAPPPRTMLRPKYHPVPFGVGVTYHPSCAGNAIALFGPGGIRRMSGLDPHRRSCTSGLTVKVVVNRSSVWRYDLMTDRRGNEWEICFLKRGRLWATGG